MRQLWALGVVAVLACAVGCSNDGSGGGGGGPDAGPLPDGGCTGSACNPGQDGGPDGGGPDGGGPDAGVASPLRATPDRIVIGTTPGTAKSAQLTLQNVSSGALTLQSFGIDGPQASAFQVSGGGSLPATLQPGASVDVTIGFNGAAGVSRGTLSAVTSAGATAVPLGALATSAEPSLQWIFDVHNIPVNAGNPDPTKRDFPPVLFAGDETGIQSFVKAGDGPVTLQLIGSFGPPAEPVGINGWYPSGNGAGKTELFRIAQANAQVLDPPIENGGTLSFDPGTTAFGFWNEWPYWETSGKYVVYQEDRLNTWDTGAGGVQHHMRVYPYRNPDGSLEPHAYIVTTEEAPISAGPDYNDIVYIVRNVSPAAGAGGALQIQNLDAFPADDFTVFSTITTITNCYTPLSVKDSGVIRIRNLSGGTIAVSSIGTTPEFMANPSVPLPKDLASGESFDVTVNFVATTGRVVRSALTITSNDPAAPTRTVTLSGFRQVAPQSPNEPTLQEVVHDLFGYGTTIVGPGQDIDNEGQLEAVGDEVLSPYWVKADLSQPVSVRLMSAWHSGYYNCKTPPDVSYGSFIWWFEKGLKSPDNDHYLMGASKEDVQRVLPRDYEDPSRPATSTFDPGTKVFGWRVEQEYSDEKLQQQEPACPTDGGTLFPCCPAGVTCGHRVRFWPIKLADGTVVPNTYVMSIDWHVPDFSTSNYDFNDETYFLQNIKPAP